MRSFDEPWSHFCFAEFAHSDIAPRVRRKGRKLGKLQILRQSRTNSGCKPAIDQARRPRQDNARRLTCKETGSKRTSSVEAIRKKRGQSITKSSPAIPAGPTCGANSTNSLTRAGPHNGACRLAFAGRASIPAGLDVSHVSETANVILVPIWERRIRFLFRAVTSTRESRQADQPSPA